MARVFYGQDTFQSLNHATHTRNRFTAFGFCPGPPGWTGTRKVNQSGFTGARDNERQWYLLGHMQICTLPQTGNHANIPPLSFLQARYPSCCPTNSVKALKAKNHAIPLNKACKIHHHPMQPHKILSEVCEVIQLTRDTVYYNKGTIGDTKCCGYFWREVHVSGRIYQVDKKRANALFSRLCDVY